jgi:hypothetical protein
VISGKVAFTDSIATTSNQLNSTTGGIACTYSYDAAGNTSTPPVSSSCPSPPSSSSNYV